MGKYLVPFFALTAVSMVHAGGQSPEAFLKDYLKTTKEAASVLGSIKDEETAEAAKAKLDTLGTRLENLAQKLQAAAKSDGKTTEALGKKYEKQLQAQAEALNKECVRLEKLPASAESYRVYVTNSAGDSVHVIDTATNKVVQVIKNIESAHGVTFAPDAHWGLLDMIAMESELTDLLGRKVDLVSRRGVEQSRNRRRRTAILESAEPIYVAGRPRLKISSSPLI